MVLVRQEIGDVLRDFRLQKGRTLRQVAGKASVALGYLSEVERGQKEASSEILASVADALEVPISVIMRQVSDRLAALEGVVIPDTIPLSSTQTSTSQPTANLSPASSQNLESRPCA
jgi:transcriptional regulator with XRE-family HTH domain